LARTLDEARPGDVVVTMSSGSFDGMPHRVLEGLRAPQPEPRRAAETAAQQQPVI